MVHDRPVQGEDAETLRLGIAVLREWITDDHPSRVKSARLVAELAPTDSGLLDLVIGLQQVAELALHACGDDPVSVLAEIGEALTEHMDDAQ